MIVEVVSYIGTATSKVEQDVPNCTSTGCCTNQSTVISQIQRHSLDVCRTPFYTQLACHYRIPIVYSEEYSTMLSSSIQSKGGLRTLLNAEDLQH